jgi:tellurite resistance protein
MIIFGTRGVKSTLSQGNFNCPQCETTRAYKKKKVTRFFTLYFIPLIPLGKVGEYVECQHCKGTFIPNVLNYEEKKNNAAQDFLAEYEKAMKHSLVLMMLADGVIDDREREMVIKIYNKISHHDMTSADLDQYIAEVEASPDRDVSKYLKGVGPMLNGQGKEMVIKAAISVAASDGHFDDSEKALLAEMAQALDMTSAHLKGIINEITTENPTFSDN